MTDIKPLTDQEKLAAYKWAKAQIGTFNEPTGVCALLRHWVLNSGRQNFYFHMNTNGIFPEFAAQRPVGGQLYWWPLNEAGNKMRIEALENAVKLLNIPEDGKSI